MIVRYDRLFWLILVILLVTQLPNLGPALSRMINSAADTTEDIGHMVTHDSSGQEPRDPYRAAVLCAVLIAFVGVVKLWSSAMVRSRQPDRPADNGGDVRR